MAEYAANSSSSEFQDWVSNGHWRQIIAESVVSAAELARRLPVCQAAVGEVIGHYPMRLNPYVLSVIDHADDPLGRQFIPDRRELEENHLSEPDPLAEGRQSPVPHLVHRYPDRVLFLISNQCAVYCRHCMRKRAVGRREPITAADIDRAIAYIADTPAVREVLLSGGDPLLVSDSRIADILERLHRISHVEVIRIHTRAPGVLPARITPSLVDVLRRFAPLYVNIQFNHPDEITPAAKTACGMLADGGIALGSQTVLLGGVNDDPAVMTDLMRRLLAARVRPYYLHHPDPVKGTAHFRVSVEKGLAIIKAMRGRISGMGVPQYVIDLPGGGGKVPLSPDYVCRADAASLTVENFEGERYDYPL